MKLKTLKHSLNTMPKPAIAKLASPSRSDSKWSETRRTLTGRKRQAKRLDVWRSQGGKCKACNDVVDVSQFHLDHVVPLHLGGGDSDANLQALCIPCHELKTAQEIKNLST